MVLFMRLATAIACLSACVRSASTAESLAAAAGSGGGASASGAMVDWPTPSLTSSEFTDILTEEWENDHAVMLMASWCRYCRQFKPIWHEIKNWFEVKGAKHVKVVMFDCETDTESQRLCAEVGVKHYPSVLFVGHGSYWASDPFSVNVLGKPKVPERSVLYAGDLFFESVRDWCRTMRFLSRVSRWTSYAASALGIGQGASGSSSSGGSKLDKLKADNVALKVAAAVSAKLAAERAAAAASQAKLAAKYGSKLDAFEVLSAANYGILESGATVAGAVNGSGTQGQAAVTAIKKCVAEVTAQYCEGRTGGSAAAKVAAAAAGAGGGGGPEETEAEPYCGRVVECWQEGFTPKACRPLTCPLHQGGCAFASICLNPEVLEQFTAKAETAKKGAAPETPATAVSEAVEAETSAAGVSTGAEETPRAATGDNAEEVSEVDPAVAAAAAAASAAATGIGRAGGRRSGPRRRSLWDDNANKDGPSSGTEVAAGKADEAAGEAAAQAPEVDDGANKRKEEAVGDEQEGVAVPV